MKTLSVYSMRPLAKEDLKMVLEWRNSDRIHSLMLTDHRITWEEHQNWFQRIKQYNPIRNFVFEYKKESIGYIGYTDYDVNAKKCSPGAYLGKLNVSPIDTGLYLMYMSVEYAFEQLQMSTLETVVFQNNKRALKIDEFIGYKIVADKVDYYIKNGQREKVVLLELNKKDWIKKKEELANFI
ncbi:UDP-4-amino-4,6-dideoxy-N-acetyl-beta-L-altrosamine N-acetyltransferase [Propionispira raffinosivorans]|uniref:UDP-4-amino-4, 6-dideoxy-N-acetyl-beta-L-altrosamine N-acetyltransferase n=1 Tax=Propionispira raffinosivorans TaxID=86959 RepID=UPI0003697354|nr:UDP-4-amino-4,6-dideoxy-N-acetyl-beta-L-altrosamine N-acetyltransferase [Propionispira raffinosivorans]